jgi:ubiquinone/menaquinone biosynthesis C-methylase UbiE
MRQNFLKFPLDRNLTPLEKSAQARNHYSAIAESLDDPRFIFMNFGYASQGADGESGKPYDQVWRYSINLLRYVTEDVELDGKRILDVGCGRGGSCFYLDQHFRLPSIVGLDSCFEGLRSARKHGLGKSVKFVCANACKLPVADRSIEVVINIESSHCYEDLSGFFSEIGRVLEPGGMFCYADSFFRTSIRNVDQILANKPFELIRRNDITAGVIRSLELNKEGFLSLLDTIRTNEPANNAMIEHLVEGIYTHAYNAYKSGELAYFHWLLRRR